MGPSDSLWSCSPKHSNSGSREAQAVLGGGSVGPDPKTLQRLLQPPGPQEAAAGRPQGHWDWLH